ncbi:hypothetical protein FBY21_2736 [Pseudomonas sp. SLBN-26]|uniref:hypothetical protein n=1 Tax=Pseudomonadaceae TaxID=135621 RepID=UPI00114E31F3|nr:MULTISPECIES: hypothetical protein [Pseudomonas]MCP1618119.1 hypothetical protein [Pseudomonas otitidis]TQL07356.1 hypothetical protein FBY21_2736 [Pseudomonas sp. SLBN-26]
MYPSIRVFALLGLLLLVGGCVPTSEIIPSTDGGSFVVTQDLVRFEEGLLGPPRLIGLTPGEYIAVGHNSDGVYYRGPKGGVLILPEKEGQEYLRTGQRATHFIVGNTPVKFNDEGGIFVPYDSDATPWYYYYADFRNITGETDSKLPPRPFSKINPPVDESPAGARIGGPVNVVVIELGNTTGVPSPEAAVGGALGAGIGRAIGQSALSRGQGGIIRNYDVQDERIISLIRSSVGRSGN